MIAPLREVAVHRMFDNLAFSLSVRRWPGAKIRQRVHELAELLGIEYLLSRRPKNLSGGERQRVALGRALAFYPTTLLLDEPISALDEDTRSRMEGLLMSVQRRVSVTVLHITHSPTEARRMADLIIRINDGQFEETPNERPIQTGSMPEGRPPGADDAATAAQ